MGVVSVAAAIAAGACSSDTDPVAEQRATQLIAATQQAGLAPGLTIESAEALYGADAPAFCEAHRADLDGVAGLVVRGNTAQGRRPTVTDEAIAYGRLVAEIYCPDVLDDFDNLVDEIEPFERTDRVDS